MSDHQYSWLLRMSALAIAPVIAAAVIATASLVWQMHGDIAEINRSRDVMNERIGIQLDLIADKLDSMYTQPQADADLSRIDRRIQRNAERLEELDARLRQIEDGR